MTATSTCIEINGQEIGLGRPCYIVAEMSANHGGDFGKAEEIVIQAAECGANAVKLQTYRADTITLNSSKSDFLLPSGNPWEEHNKLYSLYKKAYMPWEWHQDLMQLGKRIGIDVFSSPFDHSAVTLLESLNVPAYKIASPEITDIPLIKKVAETGKPVILSTGLARLTDIELAVDTLIKNGCSQYALLKCTTAYPAPPVECNLNTISDLAKRFNCVSGLSDHTLGIGVPIASVCLGASLIEKHFVLKKTEESVDAFFSLDPSEFKSMVDEVRNVEQAIGIVEYDLAPSAEKNLMARRSLYIVKNVKKGERLTEDNVKSIRPGFGLHPKYYYSILGKAATVDLEMGDRLLAEHIEGVEIDKFE